VSGFEVSDRGFRYYDGIETDYGHVVHIHESSRADGPCIWMEVNAERAKIDSAGHVHMTEEQAEEVIATLRRALDEHYQKR
jgi:hypothetical protein